MELTAASFRQIVESFNPATGHGPTQEQRRVPRVRTEAQATLLPFTERFGLDPLMVSVRDVSAGGLGFLHPHALPLGEHFGLLLPEETGRPVVILCTITYYQPLAQDLFAVGARFERVLRQGNAGLPLMLPEAPDVHRAAS